MSHISRKFLIFSAVVIGAISLIALSNSVSAASFTCLAGSCDQTANFCGSVTGYNVDCPGDGACVGLTYDCGIDTGCYTEGYECFAVEPPPNPPACSNNGDCNDGSSCTDDICENPGTASAFCSNPDNGSCAVPPPPPPASPSPPPPADACSDDVDNEGDGLTDWPADPGCSNPNDNNETDPLPSISSFSASPAAISAGGSSTLSWNTSNAVTATINQGIGSVAVDGSRGVTPTGTTTYTLTAYNGEGVSVQGNATVTVTNNLPQASNVTVTEPDYCAFGPGGGVTWTFGDADAGDTQSAFRVQVDDNVNFSSPEIDSGKILSAATGYVLPQGQLQFNTTYRLRMLVWDNHDGQSAAWRDQDFCNGAGCAPNEKSWGTPVHRYPSGVDFTFTPSSPQVHEVVEFVGAGTCYDNAGNPTACASWLWSPGDGTSMPSTQTSTHAYTATGAYTATLQLQDGTGFICPATPVSKQVKINIRVPNWREVLPR